MDLEQACMHEGMGIEFDNTAPGIPQQNHHVEWKFTTLLNRVYTMLSGGKFSSFSRNGLWAEAANVATLLKNNFITPN